MAQRPKATLLFEDGKTTWSETYFYVPATDDLVAVRSQAKIMGALRIALTGVRAGLGPTVNLRAIRVSFDDVFRDALIDASLSGKTGTFNKALVKEETEVPWSTLLLRMESGSLYRRSLMMSGVPQTVVEDPDGPILNADFKSVFDPWVAYMTSGKWGFRVTSRDPTAAPEMRSYLMAPVPDTNYVKFTVPAHPFAVGDTVHIRGGVWGAGAGGKPVRGDFVVSVVPDANHIDVVVPFVPGVLQTFAILRKRLLAVTPFTSIIPVGMAPRKRGVLGGSQRRGRARKRT